MKKDLEKEIGWLLKEKYHHKPTQKFDEDVKRLKAGEPVDYVIGFTEFLKCKIDLSQKTLIPRKETEFWVKSVISALQRDKRSAIRCLDLFSGSGCVGVAILKKQRGLLCDMADKDKKAIEQIKINCKLNNINSKRYKIIQSDVFLKVRGKYDYIFANPPYVSTKKIYNIGKSVLKYEPKSALFSGSDGLFHIRKFLGQAKNRLNPGGKIFMEFSPEQKSAIEKIIIKNKYADFKFKVDQFNRWRWVEISG